ncbi:glycosyl transferase family 2 [Methylocella silvestris BL2]|uniref:Glycosyl transferase family 2 n=1 Tax=Methylocella silvestris (strain DSM 15510 / CIP 108128 / LMG 27833 / NCIMB 13906 / BL2) TaxID=395965 RepID=B8EIZ0_METSB|nr:glycosyltransferase family A protein [Methylocella silvestris]ACK52482.1 glycosyl transferase family 2 [Methylocella silvestris BL2]
MNAMVESPAELRWIERRYHASAQRTPPRIVVAIPARNEADRIGNCLRSLAEQRSTPDGPALDESFGVLLFVNGSSDETFEIAAALAPRLGFPIRIYDAVLSANVNHAGGARRIAMDLAAGWLEETEAGAAYLLTTDADSRPASDWIAENLRAFARGADAVAGRIELDAADEARLCDELRARGALEASYEDLLTEIFARLDPRPHDPWRRHAAEPGASFALSLSAYRSTGGLPAIPSGEDRALASLIETRELKLRHEPAVVVVTSGRLVGRANGGVADALCFRTAHPDAECDPYLEPVLRAIVRGFWRGRLRRLHAAGELTKNESWTQYLKIDAVAACGVARLTPFSRFWELAESLSPSLRRRSMRPHELPLQIMLARLALGVIRRLSVNALEGGPIDILSGAVADEAKQSLEPRQETQ